MAENDWLSHQFTRSDVTIHDCETVFSGYFKVNKYTLSHATFEGHETEKFSREIFERGHAVVCLPYDPISDHLVLIEQFRAGPLIAQEEHCWSFEAIAGIIEEGEKSEDVAKREALEEANCPIQKLIPTGRYFPSGGGCSEYLDCFIGLCDASTINGIHGLHEESENIRAFTVPFQEALDAAMAGKLNNLPLTHLIFWLALQERTHLFDQ